MKPDLIRKKFLLVGLETKVDFSSNITDALDVVRGALKQRFSEVPAIKEPIRMVGFWQPGGVYFAGVEVVCADSVADDFIVKDLPESLFASFREVQRGTVGGPGGYAYQEWLPASGYWVNSNLPGDFEVFCDIEHYGEKDECEVLIPIVPNEKASGSPD